MEKYIQKHVELTIFVNLPLAQGSCKAWWAHTVKDNMLIDYIRNVSASTRGGRGDSLYFLKITVK